MGLMSQPNGPYGLYEIRLELSQDGAQVWGQSRIQVPGGEKWGLINFQGSFPNGILLFEELEITGDNLFLESWCLKSGELRVSPDGSSMRGPWQASGCSGGELTFQRENGKSLTVGKQP